MTINRRRICRHLALWLSFEQTGWRFYTIVGRQPIQTLPVDQVDTGRVRVRCLACGLDRTFTTVDVAPQWVQDLAKLTEAPA